MKRILIILFAVLVVLKVSHAEGFPAVEVYQDTSKAVVLIVAQKNEKSSMAGAGSFITSSGYIVTNAHVVIDKSTSRPYSAIRVFVKPDKVTGDFSHDLLYRHKARVIAYDTGLDLALLKLDEIPDKVTVIKLANPEDIPIGEEVVAIGHPEQGGLWSLTYGRISGEIANQSGITGKDVFQTDTSVNRGNSGGPLLDRRGYMVGINTNIARLGADNMPITGVNFALKSSVVRNWLDTQGVILAYGTAPMHREGTSNVTVADTSIKPEEKGSGSSRPSAGGSGESRQQPSEGKKDVKKAEETSSVKREAAEGLNSGKGEGPAVVAPEAEPSVEEKKSEEPKASKPEEEKGKTTTEDRILTPRKPYTFDELFSEVEKEMEDMMQEMKGEIEKRKSGLERKK